MKKVFIFPIQVRFRDIGGRGHVNNTVFFTYFTDARLAFFQKIADCTDFPKFPFIMAHIRCNYLRPVTLNTRFFLQIWVKEIGGKSFRLSYQLVDASDGSTVYAEGESVQICFDYAENKSIAVPDELKQQLHTYRS